MHEGAVAPSGGLGLTLIRGDGTRQAFGFTTSMWPVVHTLLGYLYHGLPRPGLGREVNRWRWRNFPNLWRGLWKLAVARTLRLPHFMGELWLTVYRGDGTVVPLGLASLRVVTDTGVGYIVDAFQNSVELENMKYHGFGTGVGAEAVGNTALGTEFTTQYAVDSTRPTGSTTEAAANIYQTVATFSPDSGGTLAVTEHGILSQAATGGGVLLDRTQFSAVNVVAGSDSIQSDYRFTITSGS